MISDAVIILVDCLKKIEHLIDLEVRNRNRYLDPDESELALNEILIKIKKVLELKVNNI